MKDLSEAIERLRTYNQWRRGTLEKTFDELNISTAQIGEDIDDVGTFNEKSAMLLRDIQEWMIDNDYECGKDGGRLYDEISELLGRDKDE